MRIKKIVLMLSILISLLSISILFILEFSTITIFNKLINHKSFIINLLTGIFTSSLLLVLVYFVEYSEVRKNTLKKLEWETLYYLGEVKRIKMLKYTSNYDSSEDSILQFAKQCSNLSTDSIRGIIECYCEIDFFTGKTNRNIIYNELIFPIQELDSKIRKLNSIFNNYPNEIPMIRLNINSIHKILYKSVIVSTINGGYAKYYNKFNSKINIGLSKLHEMTYYKKKLPKIENPISSVIFEEFFTPIK